MREGPMKWGGRRCRHPVRKWHFWLKNSHSMKAETVQLRPSSALRRWTVLLKQRVRAGVGKGVGRSGGDKAHAVRPVLLPSPPTLVSRANQAN